MEELKKEFGITHDMLDEKALKGAGPFNKIYTEYPDFSGVRVDISEMKQERDAVLTILHKGDKVAYAFIRDIDKIRKYEGEKIPLQSRSRFQRPLLDLDPGSCRMSSSDGGFHFTY